MTQPKCIKCGTKMIKMLNIDKRERGGGAIMWLCPNVNAHRVEDGFKGDKMYTHLEIYCEPNSEKKSLQ